MKAARAGLKTPVREGDYDGLVEVMGHLMKVKERQVATDNMFEPLKQTIELLRTYGEEMPEEIHVKLQVGGGGGLGVRDREGGQEPWPWPGEGLWTRPPLVDTEQRGRSCGSGPGCVGSVAADPC